MNSDYHFSLGDLAFTVRKINGLTQVEYSKRLGVVQSTISKVEKDIFDDIPFSLVDKISTEFNIPITYFQMGLLPLRKSNSLYKSIPKPYIEEGVFKAKTIYYILKDLEKKYSDKIYKNLKLAAPLLCLNNISYSFEFINKMYSLTQQDLLESIKNISNQFNHSEEVTLNEVYRYLSDFHKIKISSEISSINLESGIIIEFDSDIHELDKVYAELLKLELQILFNAKFSINEATAGKFKVLAHMN